MTTETESSLLREELLEGRLYLSHQPPVASRAGLSLPHKITSSVTERALSSTDWALWGSREPSSTFITDPRALCPVGPNM